MGDQFFYDDHKAFSAKAALFITRFNPRLDWSCLDTEVLILHVGGHRPISCSLCFAVGHLSGDCPRSLLNVNSGMALTPNLHFSHDNMKDSRSREVLLSNDRQICNNFNENVCTYQQCRFSHVCSFCGDPHPKSVCPRCVCPAPRSAKQAPPAKQPRLTDPF